MDKSAERQVITDDELLQRYAAGERDFARVKLWVPEGRTSDETAWRYDEGSVLNHANLSEINLRDADIRLAGEMNGTDFSNADLRGALLDGNVFRGANFSGADLRNTCFVRSKLDDANFSGADMRGARLSHAPLCGANFEGANLGKASFFECRLVGDMSGLNLRGTVLEGTDIMGMDFSGADLRGASLKRAYLNSVNFTGAKLTISALEKSRWIEQVTLPDGSIRNDGRLC